MKSVRGHGAYHVSKGSRVSYLKHKARKYVKKYVGGKIGQHVGRHVGSMFGPNGSLAGEMIGSALGSIAGHGSYKIQSNTLAIPGTQIPSFDKHGRPCTRIKHREYCFDILSNSSAFSNTSYSLNPCNTVLFPFLSTLMANFQEYSWDGLIFEFRSESGMAVSSTNTGLGYIALATDYDATNPAFVDKQQLLNSEFSVDGPPSSNILHLIECKRSETALNNLYTNTGFVPAGADQRLYDIGLLNVAVGQQQSTGNVLGSLWVSYDICAYKSIIGFTGASQNATHYVATTGLTFAPTAPSYFGSNTFQHTGSTFSLAFNSNTNTITFPPNIPTGNYELTYITRNSSFNYSSTSGQTFPVISLLVNCTDMQLYSSSGYVGGISGVGGGLGNNDSSKFFLNYPITLTGPSAQIQFTGGSALWANGQGTISNMDLIVQQLPSIFT